MSLRPYQQEAVDAIIRWVEHSVSPCLIEAATGSGKSHIIAETSKILHQISGGRHILCLAPSGELVEQNYAKYINTGNFATMYSASVGEKSLAAPVVFGTPKSVLNNIEKFTGSICAVQIDEAHELTPTIKSIINAIQDKNPLLRRIGYTATPYRTGEGYIYAMDEESVPVSESMSLNPYFTAKIYTITARDLISRGYLTPPIIMPLGAGVERYHTLHMQLNARGLFDNDDIDRAYHGQGRKTSRIIQDIIYQSAGRRGVLIFAATLRHAEECFTSLPKEISAIVTGKTPKTERRRILTDFKAGRIKYVVNVAVLTRGFDAPHIDVIALLRATESPSLFQQIIGRGLRLCDGKNDCLVLDYAENIERHCPEGDIFDPEIKVYRKKNSDLKPIIAVCPLCGAHNEFTPRKNEEGYNIDTNGYYVDLVGDRIPTDYGDMPSHYGRRCRGLYLSGYIYERCEYRWTSKVCPSCGADNDIAAKHCTECKAEIVDPNEKLRIEFKEFKKDTYKVQTDTILSFSFAPTVTNSGIECIKVECTTDYRAFNYWVFPNAKNDWLYRQYAAFFDAVNNEKLSPTTITYRKNRKNGFFEVMGYNKPPDEMPVVITKGK